MVNCAWTLFPYNNYYYNSSLLLIVSQQTATRCALGGNWKILLFSSSSSSSTSSLPHSSSPCRSIAATLVFHVISWVRLASHPLFARFHGSILDHFLLRVLPSLVRRPPNGLYPTIPPYCNSFYTFFICPPNLSSPFYPLASAVR